MVVEGRGWRRVRAGGRAAGGGAALRGTGAAGRQAWSVPRERRGGCETGGLDAGELLGGLDGSAVGADDLHAEEVAGGVFLEADHHGLEHLEGLFLVGDERVLLGVAAEADAFLEVVHGEEVILPEAVEDGEHDDALVVAHLVGAEDLFLDVVAGAELLEDGLAELVTVERGDVDLSVFEASAEEVVELVEELLESSTRRGGPSRGRSRRGCWRGWWRGSRR